VEITREFGASRADLFRAYTEPDLVSRWMGPRQYSLEIREYDVRAGGSWAFVNRASDGTEYAFRGVFHSVTPGEQIVQTFEFLGAPGHVSLESATFEDRDEGSRVVIRSAYQSVADRDAILEAGMADGVTEGFEKMDAVLEELRR
jgi:uncharacterized protein YndB with AHSA1/START domain